MTTLAIDLDALRVAHPEAYAALTERPSDWAYFGDLPLGETWAMTGPSVTRDDKEDSLTKVNFDTIHTDLAERFPTEVDIVRSSHWACGWVESLAVRVITDAGAVTPAFEALLEWRDRLQKYPVADEDEYERRRDEAWREFVEEKLIPVAANEGIVGLVVRYLWDEFNIGDADGYEDYVYRGGGKALGEEELKRKIEMDFGWFVWGDLETDAETEAEHQAAIERARFAWAPYSNL